MHHVRPQSVSPTTFTITLFMLALVWRTTPRGDVGPCPASSRGGIWRTTPPDRTEEGPGEALDARNPMAGADVQEGQGFFPVGENPPLTDCAPTGRAFRPSEGRILGTLSKQPHPAGARYSLVKDGGIVADGCSVFDLAEKMASRSQVRRGVSLRLSRRLLGRSDEVREQGESLASFIRVALQNEVERRQQEVRADLLLLDALDEAEVQHVA